jgi:hypothetical protein
MTRHRRNRRTPNAAAEPHAHGMPWAAARAGIAARVRAARVCPPAVVALGKPSVFAPFFSICPAA